MRALHAAMETAVFQISVSFPVKQTGSTSFQEAEGFRTNMAASGNQLLKSATYTINSVTAVSFSLVSAEAELPLTSTPPPVRLPLNHPGL